MDTRKLRITSQVIQAINEELDYVGTLSEQGRSDKQHHGAAGQLLTLKVYTDKAIVAWVNNPGNAEALHQLRKCAAIAVRAMLTEGCLKRSDPDDEG